MTNKSIKKLEADLWESADLLRAGSKLTSQQYCMSEEEQRYVREGFSNDEELSIYDLLFSENLSKSDIVKIKKISVDLLKKIKERITSMDHWTDKQETRAEVDVLIRNVLYEEIPDSMFERLDAYRKAIYEHI